MIAIPVKDKALLERAEKFSKFRDECKSFLTDVDMNYDKFTIVSHDSYIGYISEAVIRDYLSSNLPTSFKVKSWEECCDMVSIYKAVQEKDYSKAEIVKEYFYDKWDIVIETPKRSIHIDVKTALTKLEPKPNWDFLYPVVQAKKEGKDYTILAYCVYEAPDKLLIRIVDVIGYLDNEKIKHCRLIRKGWYTSHHTKSQADNYETLLGRDYQELDSLILELKKELK